jgi:hypothetical protein
MEDSQQVMNKFKHAYLVKGKKINKQWDQLFERFTQKVSSTTACALKNGVTHLLNRFSEIVVIQKNSAFIEFQQRNNIDDYVWENYKGVMRNIQGIHEKEFLRNWENLTDDPEIPRWFSVMQKKQLQVVGINSQSVAIQSSEKVDDSAKKLRYSPFCNHHESLSLPYRQPGAIFVNPHDLDVNNLDLMEGKALLLAHMMKLLPVLGIPFNTANLGIEIKDPEWEAVHHSLLLRRQAALIAALESKRNAYCIKLVSLSNYCIAYDLELHEHFVFIDFCWKVIDWVDQYYSNNDSKTFI